jgi:hypothetical protein
MQQHVISYFFLSQFHLSSEIPSQLRLHIASIGMAHMMRLDFGRRTNPRCARNCSTYGMSSIWAYNIRPLSSRRLFAVYSQDADQTRVNPLRWVAPVSSCVSDGTAELGRVEFSMAYSPLAAPLGARDSAWSHRTKERRRTRQPPSAGGAGCGSKAPRSSWQLDVSPARIRSTLQNSMGGPRHCAEPRYVAPKPKNKHGVLSWPNPGQTYSSPLTASHINSPKYIQPTLSWLFRCEASRLPLDLSLCLPAPCATLRRPISLPLEPTTYIISLVPGQSTARRSAA